MSIIRVSCKRDAALAPDARGNLTDRPYDRRRLRGQMGKWAAPTLPSSDPDLDHYLERLLEDAAADLEDAPVVAMTHGFMYDPCHSAELSVFESDNGHRRLFHFESIEEDMRIRTKTASWPLDLGFEEEDGGASGLALAFAWHSKPGFAKSLMKGGQNFYARAYSYAEESAWVFACMLEAASRLLEKMGKPNVIDLYAHSLGSRIVVRAIAQIFKYAMEPDADLSSRTHGRAEQRAAEETRERLRALSKRINRIIILGGSEYVVEGQLMFRRLLEGVEELSIPAGAGPHIYNIVTRENDVLDILGENFGPRTFGNTNVLGHNGVGVRMEEYRSQPGARWCDMPIDSAALQRWMSDRGVTISGDQPGQVWDHWYYYTFPGNADLYRRILRERDEWSHDRIVADKMPQGIDRGWLFGD